MPTSSSACLPARARWYLLALAWALFLGSLPWPMVRWNGFMRWLGWSEGLDFHAHVIAGLPRWIIHNITGGDLAYIPLLDFLWWVPALAAIALFLASPLIFLRVRQPTTLFCLRYVGLCCWYCR